MCQRFSGGSGIVLICPAISTSLAIAYVARIRDFTIFVAMLINSPGYVSKIRIFIRLISSEIISRSINQKIFA